MEKYIILNILYPNINKKQKGLSIIVDRRLPGCKNPLIR